MLNVIKPRLYQESIFSSSTTKNTLVVLPTGLGKTTLAMMLTKHRLKQHPDSKILILAPTKPLVEQHYHSFMENVDGNLVMFTGEIPPAKREKLWNESNIIFSTPQGLENDVISGRIDLNDTSLIVFDEAHRAVGDYAYAFIAKQYNKRAKFPRVLALTASPGSDLEKIDEVCKNLNIENIETRTEDDPDVKQYVQDVEVNWIKVDLPASFKFIKKTIEKCYYSKLNQVKDNGFLNSIFMRKYDLLKLQGTLHGKLSSGEKSFELLKSISLLAEAMKIQHALELLETQGINSLYLYFSKLIDESTKTKVKAVKNLVVDENFRLAYEMTKKLYDNNIEHPKIKKIQEVVLNNKNEKMIIFSQYRDTGAKIKQELDQLGVSSKLFVGQAKKRGFGMNQKEQKKILDEFRNDEFEVLIATSVAEEGLDVPSVDLVVFYEPIPSAIRTIQRRGRTGRNESGKVIMLVTNNTRDEAYRWSSHHKEKRMRKVLSELKTKLALQNEKPLEKYISTDIKVICDDREKSNTILKLLSDQGIKVELKRLDVGDYQLSDRCIVELKRIPDFVDSIIDGRLLEQLKYLVKVDKPILIIEGTEDIYSQRNIHPNAILGMISTITVSYGIPVIQTKNSKETADLLKIIAKREQDPSRKEFSAHGSKKPLDDKELQEYIISALPNVGTHLAKELLHEFRSVRKVLNASEDELKNIAGVGDKIAKEIQRTLDKDYYV